VFAIVDQIPPFDNALDYRKMYWGTYVCNQQLITDLNNELQIKNQLRKQVVNYSPHFISQNTPEPLENTESMDMTSGRKKHIRRAAKEIIKTEV